MRKRRIETRGAIKKQRVGYSERAIAMTGLDHTAAFEAGQREVLELIAGGAALPTVLDAIVRLIEAQGDGMWCSILLLERGSSGGTHSSPGRLRHGAAPHLPRELVAGIDGSEIGPREGSCGAAAFLGEPITIADIAAHPNWAAYKQLVLPHGLRACWSNPIFAAKGGPVLGTFAMYHREARGPTARELHWVARATHLAAIALSRDAALQTARTADARYRHIVDTAYEGVWLLDGEGRTLFVNQRTAHLLGMDKEELLGRPLTDFLVEHDGAADELVQRLMTNPEQQEVRLRRKDGVTFWALVSGGPMRDDGKDAAGALAMITDISALKRTEEALRQSESSFRTVFENAAFGMALLDTTGRPLRSNPALQKLLDRSHAQLAQQPLSDLALDEDKPATASAHAALLAGARDRHQLECRFVVASGAPAWCRVTVSLVRGEDGAPRHAIALFEDVTERRRMEEAVRSSERLRALMYSAVSDVVFYLGVEPGPRFRFLSVNPAFLRTTGLKEEDVVGRLVDDVFPEPARAVVTGHYEQAIRERRVVVWQEVSQYPAGKRYGEVSVTPVFDGAGVCTTLVGTVHDVTERHVAHERLAKQAALLDKTSDAILVCALDGVIEFWNKGAERIYGFSAAEAIGRRLPGLLGDAPGAVSFAEAAQSARARGDWSGDLLHHTKAGQVITVEGRWTLLQDDAGAPQSLLAVHTDVTEKRRFEARVLRAKRLESLGLLAGGIAHDFNNILLAMMGNVSFAADLLGGQHPASESLSEVEEAGARAAALVRQILTFSRQEEPKRELLTVEPVAREVLRLLAVNKPPAVHFAASFAADVPKTLADPTHLHQVLMNLGTNALHALSGAGALSMRADRFVAKSAFEVRAKELPAGDYLRLTVSDTGVGMSEATLERMFDPFFSTKSASAGTGLGLSVVYGIVESHRGGIAVHSTLGAGTEVTVYLPAA